MTRPLALLAACSILISCATPSPRLPPAEPIPPPEPKAADPRLCAAPETEPPVEGSIVAPVTAEERAATAAFLASTAALADWGRAGWALVSLARAEVCGD